MGQLIQELKRRNVIRVAVAYAVVSWLILQIADVLMPLLSLPEWVGGLVFLLLVVGFLLALILSWAYELTPEGIKLEADVAQSSAARGLRSRKLDFAIIGLMAISIAYLVLDNNVLETVPPQEVADVSSNDMLREGRIMLAVLPLANLSDDPGQEFFSDGLTEELIAQLGDLQRDRLGVIARTSAMHYKDQNKRVDEIARELGVDYVLEGSVRRAGDRVRITAQLIQTSDQSQLWAESFERNFDDIFSLQNEITNRITRTLKLELLPAEQARLRRVRPANAEAYEAFLKGRYHENLSDQVKLMTSIGHYEAAIQADPEYALAYASLAHAWYTLGWAEMIPFAEARKKVVDYRQKAAELDPDLAEVEMLIAEHKFGNWDWTGAEAGYRRAWESDPGSELVAWHYVICLHLLGRFEEAMAAAESGLKLNPHSRWLNEQLAGMYVNMGHYERAIDQYQKTIRLAPQIIRYHRSLGNLYADLGRDEEAVHSYLAVRRLAGDSPERVQTLWGAFTENGLQGYWGQRLRHLQEDATHQQVSPVALVEAHARLGQKDQALEWIGKLKVAATSERVPPRTIASLYLLLGDHDQALTWLERAVEQRSRRLGGLKVSRKWNPLRNDPRFQDLLRLMNFPE